MLDLRQAARRLWRHRSLTISSVLILGAAIGAGVTVFAVSNALRAAGGASDPDRTFVLWLDDPQSEGGHVEVSYPDVKDWRARTGSMMRLAAFGSVDWGHTLSDVDGPRVLSSRPVSPGFFETVGAAPFLGRTFVEADDAPSAPQVAILSFALWQGRCGGDPSVLGRTLRLEGDTRGVEPFTVVGVMPASFDFPAGTEIWTPLGRRLATATRAMDAEQQRWLSVLYAVGTLRPGVAEPAAAAALTTVARSLAAQHETHDPQVRPVFTPIQDFHLGGRTRPALRLLGWGMALLWLIAVVNVSGLLVARLNGERNALWARWTLGAGRARLMGDVVSETLLLGGMGFAIGLAVAVGLVHSLALLGPLGVPGLRQVTLGTSAMSFAVLAAGAAAVVISLVPVAWTAKVAGRRPAAADRTAAPAWTALRRFVELQAAIATLLAVASSLLVLSDLNLSRADLGYARSGVLTISLRPPASHYAGPAEREVLVAEVLRRLRMLPGITAAGAIGARPLRFGAVGWDVPYRLPGQDPERAARNPSLQWQPVTSGALEALGVRLVAGRLFGDTDNERSERVVMVGEGLARRLWPGTSALGQRIFTAGGLRDAATHEPIYQTVVGVVSDGRYRQIDSSALDIFVPAAQSDGAFTGTLVLRFDGDRAGTIASVRSVLASAAPEVPVDEVMPLDTAIAAAASPWRFTAMAITALAGMGCALCAAGLWAMLAHALGRRRKELAIRQALGATPSAVVRLMARDGIFSVAVGALIGGGLSMLGERVATSFLYGVQGSRVVLFVLVPAGILLLGGAVSYLASRGAARIDVARGLDSL